MTRSKGDSLAASANQLMADEIRDQPEALDRNLGTLREQVSELPLQGAERALIFTGSGDSFMAPLALEYATRLHTQIAPHTLTAMESARYYQHLPGSLVLAISVSGEAQRTLEAAEAARTAGATVVAVTANANASLTRLADATLLLGPGSRSRQTPHTTDFMLTLLAIATIIERLSGRGQLRDLDEVPSLVETTVRTLAQPCNEIATTIAHRDRFTCLGSGPSRGVCQYGAAKFWEAGGIAACAFDLEEFGHGPHLTMEPGDAVIVVAPRGASESRAQQIAEGLATLALDLTIVGGAVSVEGGRNLPLPEVSEEWSPFVTAVALQWLCWSVATVKGYDVIDKSGRVPNPQLYEAVHRVWVRG